MRLALLALLFPALAFADGPRDAPRFPHRAVCSGGTYRCFARVQTDDVGRARADATPQGLGPTELAAAYRIPTANDPGATVAVIDAYGYPSLEADLAVYRAQYGLPPCTVASGCLTIVNQSGQTTPLPAPPPAQDDWTQETALDVDMASAGCPRCKILVVQATNDRGNGLVVANTTAATLGATVISNSWGGPESASQDAYFTHAGVAIFASTGDNGFETQGASYPAASPRVIAVGGTSLIPSPTTVRGWVETAWNGGGSACSSQAAKPAWQTNSACAHRMTADVAAVGDPSTGVAVYANGSWGIVGGTSASSPLVAAIYATTHHNTEIGEFAYTHAGLFFDVESGTNGTCGSILCKAGIGWDGPTGVGSPNAAGLAGATAPTLAITPTTGATIDKGFTITATCTPTDGATIARVDILIDNLPFAPLTAPPFAAEVLATRFPTGHHTIAVTCTTSALLTATATAAITTADACQSPTDCPNATDICFDSVCIAGEGATGGLGATCGASPDCVSGSCGQANGESHCVITCDAMDSCPAGFDCTSNVCWPAGAGGGCNSGGQAPLWLGLALGVLTIRRRRG